MIKSIRILLLLALIQISLSSCLLWKGTILTLKQSSAYFLMFIVLASGLCAGMNFFYTRDQDVHSIINSQKKVKLFYSTLLFLNLVGVCLVLSETILTQTAFQQELVDLFLPSFFFLFGIDLLVFLPFEKSTFFIHFSSIIFVVDNTSSDIMELFKHRQKVAEKL